MDSNQTEVVPDEIVPVERDWSSMLPETLEIIKSKLSVSNQIKSFSPVCKNWKQIPPFEFAYPADIIPLLLYYRPDKRAYCNYYSPAFNKHFVVPCLIDLSGTYFRATSVGWLLLSRGAFELLLVNPFTGISLNIPQLNDHPLNFNVMAFSSPPLHSPFNFVVFGITSRDERASISVCHVGGEEARWSEPQLYENRNPFTFSHSTSVFHNGLFYCLDKNGTLATFDPLGENWTVLEKPSNYHITVESPSGGFLDKSPSKGNLLSGIFTKGCNLVRLFRLNEVEMEWEDITCLQGLDKEGIVCWYLCVFICFEGRSIYQQQSFLHEIPWRSRDDRDRTCESGRDPGTSLLRAANDETNNNNIRSTGVARLSILAFRE